MNSETAPETVNTKTENALQDISSPLDTDMFSENGEQEIRQTALPNQQSYKIKYNGEEQTLPIEDILTLAQKGMNYDKIYSRLQNDGQDSGQSAAESEASFLELCVKYPDLEQLPPETAKLVHSGVPPLYAYESFLAGQFKSRVDVLEQEARNKASAPGSAEGIGSTAAKDPFAQGFESAGFY